VTNTPLLVVMAGLVVAGCRGGAPESSTVRKAETAADRNACHLLTHEEVSP
jgi:outer membrane PBP1 activator LpoA protein